MFCNKENSLQCLTSFNTGRYGFESLLFFTAPIATTNNKSFLNPENLNVPKKSLTGFCMVQLACLSRKTFARFVEDAVMKINTTENLFWIMLLAIFATNSFAYSRPVVTEPSSATIKIINSDFKSSATYPKISRSPDMINHLRLLFSSNHKNKLSK